MKALLIAIVMLSLLPLILICGFLGFVSNCAWASCKKGYTLFDEMLTTPLN